MGRRAIVFVGVTVLLAATAPGRVGAQQCEDFNECTRDGMCMPDGTCEVMTEADCSDW